MILVRIIIGFLISAVGFLFVWKSEWFLSNIGRVDWAEHKLSGGTRIFYKLIGIGIILIGYSVITNLYASILTAFASLFVRGG